MVWSHRSTPLVGERWNREEREGRERRRRREMAMPIQSYADE